MPRVIAIALTIALLTAVLLASPARPASARPARASPGFGAMSVIAVLSTRDAFLNEASEELSAHLALALGRQWSVSDADVESPAIRLVVDPAEARLDGRGEEAVWLKSDEDGIRITGRSSIAVRHGVYILLEKLGYRWYFKHPAWTVVPQIEESLPPLDEVHEPGYIYRLLWHTSVDDGGWGRPGLFTLWRERNRLDGARNYEVYHSYDQILKAAD
ncbi:MAG: hypothetical protein HY682_05385, partial [Chloroflexi bacterium]|nr:hypothetical protein [Chloroflexota bacterium]